MSDDMDLDLEDDFDEEELTSGGGIKEMWDNNPFMKIGLLVVIFAIGGFLYMTFIAAGDDEKVAKSRMKSGAQTRGTVGEEVSVEYQEAVEEANKQRKERAEYTGGSSLPTPIGKPRGQLNIDDNIDAKNLSIDPLQEWRKTAEARRFEMDFPDEEGEDSPVPEMVPIVEPIRPEAEAVMDPELAGRLAQQMSTILSTKEPQPSQTQNITSRPSEWQEFIAEQEEMEQAALEAESFADASSGAAMSSEDDEFVEEDNREQPLIPAGQIVYAQLLNTINSDVPGPVLAHVLSGPLAGARAIGKFEIEEVPGEVFLIIKFSTFVKDGWSYDVDTVAMNPKTTKLDMMGAEVDRHYFQNIILPAAVEFVSGIGKGISQTATTVNSDDGVSTSSQDELNTEEIIATGVTESFDKIADHIDEYTGRPPTVEIEKGIPMGILFLKTLYEGDEE